MREPLRRALTSDAAIRVISRDGIGAASLRRIAKEANVPLSSLNHVYPSKEELLKDAWDRSIYQVDEVIDSVAKTQPPNLEKAVSALIRAFVWGAASVPETPEFAEIRSQLENAQRAQYELYLWALRVPEGHESSLNDYKRTIGSIEEFLGSYKCEGVNIPLLAEVLTALIDGLVLQTMSGKSLVAAQDRVDRIAVALVSSCSD